LRKTALNCLAEQAKGGPSPFRKFSLQKINIREIPFCRLPDIDSRLRFIMKITNLGIIAERLSGVGTVTREMVEQRAREIAVINGRSAQHYRQDDYTEAQRELTGSGGSEDDTDGYPEDSSRWDGVPVVRVEVDDDRADAELLVEAGLCEAEHDRMVEGSRHQRKD
jgi:hypothetical protein